MRILHLEGSPAAMGEAFGASCREAVHELYALRLANALAQARRYGGRQADEVDLLALAARSLEIARDWDPRGAEELEGIARGADLAPERVLALGGLTDLRDALAWGGELEAVGGCTAFVVQRDLAREGGVLAGQSWDLATDNMPFVVGVHRRPERGPETWCVTTAGCLSLMGLSERGLAIGTTNLRTRDARAGVPYLNVIHRALACTSHDEAVRTVLEAPRAGGHSYWIVDADGHAAVVECAATRAHVFAVERGAHVHTNHCQAPENAALEGDVPFRSSCARLARMRALLDREPGSVDVDTLRQALADRENGALAIRRDDFEGISTNAALVVAPEAGRALACQGLPDRGEWLELRG